MLSWASSTASKLESPVAGGQVPTLVLTCTRTENHQLSGDKRLLKPTTSAKPQPLSSPLLGFVEVL